MKVAFPTDDGQTITLPKVDYSGNCGNISSGVGPFAIYQSPLTLVFGQLILVHFSAYFLYGIAKLRLKSSWGALLIASAYLFYPALGYLNAWTGFHGVTAAMFFFFGAF